MVESINPSNSSGLDGLPARIDGLIDGEVTPPVTPYDPVPDERHPFAIDLKNKAGLDTIVTIGDPLDSMETQARKAGAKAARLFAPRQTAEPVDVDAIVQSMQRGETREEYLRTHPQIPGK